MKTNHIKHIWTVGGDYFCLYYSRKSNISLQFYLDQFNIDDYYIYKRTRQQREITKKNFVDFKYAGYIFFIKSKYDKENIDTWIEYFNNFGGIQFLDKPLPPYSPEKIIIRK